jgi:hypothetical protein
MRHIDTVAELIEALADFPEDSPIAVAVQPAWPFQHKLATAQLVENDQTQDDQSQDDQTEPDRTEDGQVEGTVYLAVGDQVGYLPETVAAALDW